VISFNRFTIDPARGQLFDAAGPVALTPKALSLLEYLAARPGRLVKKDELLDAIWPGTFVADGALKVCIREIRRALGDDAHAPRFIETAHRRGYRFVADVAVSPAPPEPPRSAPPAETPGVHLGPIQYARSSGVNIAYQVCGSGPIDLVFVMGWVSHLEYFWKEPSFARFLTRLASILAADPVRQARHRPVGPVSRPAHARTADGRRARGARRGRLAPRRTARRVGGRPDVQPVRGDTIRARPKR
jgi:DNA-binding winged helix-turn-helix (wHTH) protein